MFSMDQGADVGMDEDTPVTEDYVAGMKSRFTGKIVKVTVDVKQGVDARLNVIDVVASSREGSGSDPAS